MKAIVTESRNVLLFVLTVILLISVLYYLADPNAYSDREILQDGTTVYKETIDGHLYYRTGKTLTHSEACPNPSHPQNQ